MIELEHGITVYPPEADGEPWRAVFVENGARRFRQGATEAKLVGKLEKVRERLVVEASNMERPGADLIAHYLAPDRLPVEDRWSRKHAWPTLGSPGSTGSLENGRCPLRWSRSRESRLCGSIPRRSPPTRMWTG